MCRRPKAEKRACPLAPRPGFTLVEMLIVVAIVITLATLTYAALQKVRDIARRIKTKSTISKIEKEIRKRYGDYLTRRVDLRDSANNPLDLTLMVSKGTITRAQADRIRLDAIRDLMRMEMPERLADIDDPPYNFPWGHVAEPALHKRYKPFAAKAKRDDSCPASAECLYLTVMVGGSGVKGLENDTDDVDGDTLKEFVDAWGKPIYWLRWAPGFSAKLGGLSDIQSGDPVADHDPFDGRNIEPNAYQLYPLIYSSAGLNMSATVGINMGKNVHFQGNPYADASIGSVVGGVPITNQTLEASER